MAQWLTDHSHSNHDQTRKEQDRIVLELFFSPIGSAIM